MILAIGKFVVVLIVLFMAVFCASVLYLNNKR
jgi:hypothetical protein